MLSHHDAAATLAVRNVVIDTSTSAPSASLSVPPATTACWLFGAASPPFFIYKFDDAGTNEATALTWPVGDKVDEMARALKAKGVHFEHYELPQTHIEGDVHVAGERRIAWFKDPDGNIHSLVSS